MKIIYKSKALWTFLLATFFSTGIARSQDISYLGSGGEFETPSGHHGYPALYHFP